MKINTTRIETLFGPAQYDKIGAGGRQRNLSTKFVYHHSPGYVRTAHPWQAGPRPERPCRGFVGGGVNHAV